MTTKSKTKNHVDASVSTRPTSVITSVPTPPVSTSSLLAEAGNGEAGRGPAPLTSGEKLEQAGWTASSLVRSGTGLVWDTALFECVRCKPTAKRLVPAPGGVLPTEYPTHTCGSGSERASMPSATSSPPRVEAPPPSSGLDALTELEQMDQAPADAQKRATAALQATFTDDLADAIAIETRRVPYTAAVMERLTRIDKLEAKGRLREWEQALGADSTLVRQLRDAHKELEWSFRTVIRGDWTIVPVSARLARIPTKVASLTFKDIHLNCPAATPAGCSACFPARIRTEIRDCAGHVDKIPWALAVIDEKLGRIRDVLRMRGYTSLTEVPGWPSDAEVTLSHSSADIAPPVPEEAT